MKLPAKTVPAPSGGTIPLRTSKNPVLGVFLHHCGSVASVHQPKGKRKNTFYLICEECGTDQCGGKAYQEKIAANMQPNIEALQKSCEAPCEPLKPIETAPLAAHAEPQAESLTEKIAVKSVDVIPPQTAPVAVQAEKQAEPATKQPEPTEKPKRIALAALIGALGGALLAIR